MHACMYVMCYTEIDEVFCRDSWRMLKLFPKRMNIVDAHQHCVFANGQLSDYDERGCIQRSFGSLLKPYPLSAWCRDANGNAASTHGPAYGDGGVAKEYYVICSIKFYGKHNKILTHSYERIHAPPPPPPTHTQRHTHAQMYTHTQRHTCAKQDRLTSGVRPIVVMVYDLDIRGFRILDSLTLIPGCGVQTDLIGKIFDIVLLCCIASP